MPVHRRLVSTLVCQRCRRLVTAPFSPAGDERFSFLRDAHKHHAYYRQKLVQYERDLGKAKPAAAAPAPAAQTAEQKSNKPGTTGGGANWRGRYRGGRLQRCHAMDG